MVEAIAVESGLSGKMGGKKKILRSKIFDLTFRDNSILMMFGVWTKLSLYVFFSNGNRFFLKPEVVSLQHQFGSSFWH